MAVTPIRNMRVDDERWAAWSSAAGSRGVSVTKLVHLAMERELRRDEPVMVPSLDRLAKRKDLALEPAEESIVVEGPVGDVLADSRRLPPEVKAELWDAEDVLAEPLRSPAKAKKARTVMCGHRVPAGSYCSRGCDD